MITLLTLLPIFGGLLVLAFARSRDLAKAIGVVFATGALALAVMFCFGLDPATPGMQFEEHHAWAPSLGMAYHVGVDGLGVLMLALSALVVLMSLFASWNNEKLGAVYTALVLFLEAGLFGTFTALNFIHWFIYWELSLIPAFFLVRIWGGRGRAKAANQFFLYTMVGSMALLLAFLALFLATGRFDFIDLAQLAQSGQLTTALAQNLHWRNPEHLAMLLFWATFLGFAVKTPVVPFHTWLPATYAEASSETTMLLTGAMSKMGVYGFLRILLPIFPQQMQRAENAAIVAGRRDDRAAGVCRVGAERSEADLRILVDQPPRLLRARRVCVAAKFTGADTGLAAEKAAALTGVLLQMFSHGLTAAALFWLIALLERRSGGVRGIEDFGGLRQVIPVFCGLMGIAIFASLGLPGLNGFLGGVPDL